LRGFAVLSMHLLYDLLTKSRYEITGNLGFTKR